MRLNEILKPGAVRLVADNRDKPTLIRELVHLLADGSPGSVADPEAVYRAVIERETLKTTGIGRGLATPHAKTPGVRSLMMAVAVARRPIDFQSLDGLPVSVVVLLLAPPDQTGPYIQALARISKLMSVDAIRKRVIDATAADEVHRIFCEEEAHILKG